MPTDIPVFASPGPSVRPVQVDHPWIWLARGWRDLTQAWTFSLAYGTVVFVVSWVVVLTAFAVDVPFLLLPMSAGFALIAPLLAVGLYEISDRLETGRPIGLAVGLQALGRNPTQIGLMGVLLLLIHLVWIRIATLLFALFFGMSGITLTSLSDFLLTPELSLPFLVVGTLVGAVLAVAAFAIACVAIPMLLDRDVNVATAVATSVVAVKTNPAAMALWALLIALSVAFCFVTFGLGLIVLMPLLGHATWHAYRDLVVPPA